MITKKEEIDKKGWILVKNVFTSDEVNKLRELGKQDKNHKGDLLCSSLLSKALTDQRIIDIARECLGSDELYYFGDSCLSYNQNSKGFHKDSRDRGQLGSNEFKDENYSLIRIAVYLQDHSKHSKGICLRSYSHKHHLCNKGKIVNVKSEVGDVIVWKLTTTHSGNADVIKLFPNYALHPEIAKRFPSFMIQESEDLRLALFMTFGIYDNYAKEYRDYLKTREYAIERWEKSVYTQEQLEDMNKKNVKVYTDY